MSNGYENLDQLREAHPDTTFVSGWVGISEGTVMAYVTVKETQNALLRGSKFLDLTSAFRSTPFYTQARIKFDSLDNFFYVFDNDVDRALGMAVDKAIEGMA